MVFPFPPTVSTRLAQRLSDIALQQRLRADTSTLMALCEKSDNDIRACLSTLQFFWSRGKQLTVADVSSHAVGQKDTQKSHFTVWREIFEVLRSECFF
jgi:chromosome transmission fidelity protein 18